MNFENENIFKVIFQTFPFYKNKQMSASIKNKHISKAILKILNYPDIYKSMGRRKQLLIGHNNCICSIALLPNGNIITASDDRTLKIWNLETLSCIQTLEEVACVKSVIILPDNKLAYCTLNGYVFIRDTTNDNKIITTLNLGSYEYLNNLLLLSNGHLACTGRRRNLFPVIILDYFTERIVMELTKSFDDWLLTLVNLTGNKFACSSMETITIWDNKEYNCLKTLTRHESWIYALVYIEKENRLLSGSFKGEIRVWDLTTYECIRTIYEAHYKGIRCLLYLPNGYFASGCSWNKDIKIWDLKNYECINTLSGHKNVITSLLLLKDNRIVSASNDKTTIIWSY
jgi:WD40 repeat protein